MKVDTSQGTSRDCILSDFTLETGVYDNGKWDENDASDNLLASLVTQMELIPPPSFRFNGYHFKGKIDRLRLWSAEQVRDIHFTFNHQNCCLRCNYRCIANKLGKLSSCSCLCNLFYTVKFRNFHLYPQPLMY